MRFFTPFKMTAIVVALSKIKGLDLNKWKTP